MTSRARGPLPLLQATGFVATLDRFAMPPVLLAIAADLGAPLADVVTTAGAYFLVYGLAQPLWGLVSDRIGRVRTMRLALLLAGTFALASAASSTVLVLGVLRGLAGGFFGAGYPTALVYLGDTVPAERRQRDIADLMVGVALGTALASVAAGVLAEVASWRLAFVVTGTAAVTLSLLLRRLPEPPALAAPSITHGLVAVARSRAAALVLLLAFVEGASLLGALTLLPPAVESAGASAALAGAVAGVYGLSVLGASQLVGRLSARWHPSRLIGAGGACAAVACLVMLADRSATSGLAAAVLLGLAWVSMHSSLQTWATEVVPTARATTISFFAGSLFVGSSLGAVVVGGLAQAERYDVVYAGYAALVVPLAVGAAWGRARWRRPVGADA